MALYLPQGCKKGYHQIWKANATLGANAPVLISNLGPICNSQMLKVGPEFFLASTPSVKRALLLLLLVCNLL